MFSDRDHHFMTLALEVAQHAQVHGEVPVGAVLVLNDEVISKGWNQPISSHDPTSHAEIMALRQAGQVLSNYRLPDTQMYVTLEPCVMCMGALVNARIKRLVFAAFDETRGAAKSQCELSQLSVLNHQFECHGGLLADHSRHLLKQFFLLRRQK